MYNLVGSFRNDFGSEFGLRSISIWKHLSFPSDRHAIELDGPPLYEISSRSGTPLLEKSRPLKLHFPYINFTPYLIK